MIGWLRRMFRHQIKYRCFHCERVVYQGEAHSH